MALLDPYSGAWGNDEASHLLRRAAFGGTPAQRQALVTAGLHAAVNGLVDVAAEDPYLDQPGTPGTGTYGAPFAQLPDAPASPGNPTNIELDQIALKTAVRGRGLQAHWMYRMVYSSQPFQEAFTLFLHDHMPSDFAKISSAVPQAVVNGNDGDPGGLLPPGQTQQCNIGPGGLPYDATRRETMAVALLKEQNYFQRQEGLNYFGDLLLGIVRNPAMLAYLDNYLNVAGRPQENLAREMMELFSMGVGNYSENDIQQMAKVLTGETLPNFKCELSWPTDYGFAAIYHEPGTKTVFSQSIAFSNTGQETIDAVNLILNKQSIVPNAAALSPPYNTLPAAAIYLSWKLIQWFADDTVSLDPPSPVVLELADYLRGSDGAAYPQRRYAYDLKAAMGLLLRSEFFYDPARRNILYKNPVDYVAGTFRAFGNLADLFSSEDGSTVWMEKMGLGLFEPPDVSGWRHGKNWLGSAALINRYNWANYVAHTLLDYPGLVGIIDSMPFAYNDHAGMIAYLGDLLLHTSLATEDTQMLTDFVAGIPVSDLSTNTRIKRRKVQGLVHVILAMPEAQLK